MSKFNEAEKTLITMADVVLGLGAMVTVVMIIDLFGNFDLIKLLITIVPLLGSLIVWAILLCIAECVQNIRDIKNKLLS